MKNVLILLLIVLFAVRGFAQNPYTELSWPWLKQADMQEMNVKSILLATMDSDNKTIVRQIKLSFDKAGLLVSEESQVGFRYTTTFQYSETGALIQTINSDNIASDTIRYRIFPEKKLVIQQSVKKSGPDAFAVKEIAYSYNEVGQLLKTTESSAVLANVALPGENKLNTDVESLVTVDGEKTIIKNPTTTQTFSFDSEGKLLWSETYNSEYEISETYTYNYDQNGRLVLIMWDQNGASSKTFVTYEFYQ